MATLSRDLRKNLEKTVRQARRIAEAGALKVLEQLGVHHHEPYGSMNTEQRLLRNRLRAHGRQLGDRRDPQRGTQTIDHLIQEYAYEHWHRMLFARFLAETDLLIEPKTQVAITLEECKELAREEGADWMKLASDFAARMLPQIFHKDDPVLAVSLLPETRSELEDLLNSLPKRVFTSEDSLGWVYQFWQAERKEEVNRSEIKIGADELPAVTQLFTEDYMVLFLLHNTLGSWWSSKVLAGNPELKTSARNEDELRNACKVGDIDWSYLRFVRDKSEEGPWCPVIDMSDGWPNTAKELSILDPCMGSGHFLVLALPILVALRMADDGLSERDAVDAVLRDNLFGLEIDLRCTQIAAFNLAFAAWKQTGFHVLPQLNLACSGLPIGVSRVEWLKLAEKAVLMTDVKVKHGLHGVEQNLQTSDLKERIQNGLEVLYELFSRAPWLGSLIDPRRVRYDIFREGFDRLEPILPSILERTDLEEDREMVVAAQGMAKAATFLSSQYWLIITNVPYLKAGNQDELMKSYCERVYPEAKYDLATVFMERIRNFGASGHIYALVTQQYWLFSKYYESLREKWLRSLTINNLAILGSGAFEGVTGEVVNVCLQISSQHVPDPQTTLEGIDVSSASTPLDKASLLQTGKLRKVNQLQNLRNPDKRISLDDLSGAGVPPISKIADFGKGSVSGDGPHYLRKFWELPSLERDHKPWLRSPVANQPWSGREHVIIWGDNPFNPEKEIGFRYHGQRVLGRRGIAIGKAGKLRFCHYTGELFDDNLAVLCPYSVEDLAGIWSYCLSGEFAENIKKLDKKMSVTAGTFVKVPYDEAFWSVQQSPDVFALQNNVSTQWIFGGSPENV